MPIAMNAQNNNPSNRVAVVVVHGIADQRPGQTVRELARLLCHGSEGEPRYVKGELHEVLVPVEKLEPGSADDAASDARGQRNRPAAVPGRPVAFTRRSSRRARDPCGR